MSCDEIMADRYDKFRHIGEFTEFDQTGAEVEEGFELRNMVGCFTLYSSKPRSCHNAFHTRATSCTCHIHLNTASALVHSAKVTSTHIALC